MEMFEPSGRLICRWESSGMEEDDWCCCGGQAGLHRHNPVIRVRLQKEMRLQRIAHFLAVVCVLLVSVALAILITFALVLRGHHAPDRQLTKPADNHSPGYSEQQQEEEFKPKVPRAMLTVPRFNKSNGKFLQWESKIGLAFCSGGFNYSSGNLVVPKDGVYRVYLQITYEKNQDCKDDFIQFLNNVYYYSDEYPKDKFILSSVDTVSCAKDFDEQWRKSLYTSGLFELKANGILRVTSSHPELIMQNEYEVFFGAELLPP